MTRIALFACAATLLATPAFADPAPTRSATEIVCALTGDCAGGPGGERAKRPAEAAFSFTRPAGAKMAAKREPVQHAAHAVAPRPATSAPSRGLDMRITFASGSAEMTSAGRAEAAVFAKALAMPQLAGRRFVVEGHTDAVGDRAYNLDLSQRRAAAVQAYLVSLGVTTERVEAKGYGFDKPLPGRGGMAAANRRVQFVPAA